MGTKQNNQSVRRSPRRNETPGRVQNAAQQMQNTNPAGNFRGFIPQQRQAQSPVYTPAQENPTGRGARTAANFSVPKQEKKSGKKTLIAVLATVLALGLIAFAVSTGIRISREMAEKQRISDKVTPYDGRYCPGVWVDGISLGGMTPDEAMNAVQSQISARHDSWQVQLTFEGNVVSTINTDLLNMNVDQNALMHLMNDAWKPGHTGSQADRYDQMETLEQTPYTAYTARPSGDTQELDRILGELKSGIDVQAQDAYVQYFDPSRADPFVFVPEVYGRTLDIAPIREQLYQMVSTMTSGTLELIPTTVLPNVLQADLMKHYALIASASTPIDRHSTEERNNNIRRCFELINGTELQPGKTFSFNKVVGERSLSNGFYPAIEYINDEHVEGIGGGACQASTTLYQAAVRAGMQIVSRRPHSDSVSYADYGTDATVYWMRGGSQIDMSFKNTSDYPIYIVARVVNDSSSKSRLAAKVEIYGEDLGNVRYELSVETVEILPSILEPVYVSDKDSAAKAKDGCIVNSFRLKYTDGSLTEKKALFTDTYKPKPEKIYDPNLSND